jgi:hypothetical protein
MRNSPILDESADDELSGTELESLELAACHFNDTAFANGSEVCSGDELLRCERGKWLRIGSCDSDNP